MGTPELTVLRVLATCTHVLEKARLSMRTTPDESTAKGVPSAEKPIQASADLCESGSCSSFSTGRLRPLTYNSFTPKHWLPGNAV